MTPEEKARAYDEALALMKDCIPDKDGYVCVRPCDIFSELKESEDERIMKAIKQMYSFLPNKPEYIGSVPVKDIFAWLEKQDNKEPKKVSIWKHWKDGIAGNGEGKQIYLIKIGSVYSISSCLGCECDYIELSELDELMREEKQGEQKPTLRERYEKIAKSGWFKKNHDGMSVSDDEKVDDANYCFDCINKKGCINCENGELKETKQAPKNKMD